MGEAIAAVQASTDTTDAELAAILGLDDENGDEAIANEIEAEVLAELEVEEITNSLNESSDAEPDGEVEVAKGKTKRVSVAGKKPSEIIDLKIGEEFADLAVRTESEGNLKGEKRTAHISEFKAEIDALPKKIGEKAINAFQHLNNGVLLSVYTEDAIRFLREHGSMTVTELRDHYAQPGTGVRNKGYSKGTAGAQASQMMKLLPALGIATREDKTLIVNPESVLINMLAV